MVGYWSNRACKTRFKSLSVGLSSCGSGHALRSTIFSKALLEDAKRRMDETSSSGMSSWCVRGYVLFVAVSQESAREEVKMKGHTRRGLTRGATRFCALVGLLRLRRLS